MNIRSNTERLVHDMLPTLMGAEPGKVLPTYHSFTDELRSITADNTQLDWDEIHAATDAYHGDTGDTRQRISELAANTAALVMPWNTDWMQKRVRIHGDEGTFVACSPDGQIMASGHVENPMVPAEYGIADPWPFHKIAEAITVAKLARVRPYDVTTYQGYAVLKALTGNDSPHIGHSILIEDDKIVSVAGTTGRTINSKFRNVLMDKRPDFVAEMTGMDDHPDDLAGYADSTSGDVVLECLHRISRGYSLEYFNNPGPELPASLKYSKYVGIDLN